MSFLCTLRNINISYGTKEIFNSASFTIKIGEKIGLLGLNGMGKSTLLKIIAGTVVPENSSPPFIFDKSKSISDYKKFSVTLLPQEFPIEKYGNMTVQEYIYVFYPNLKEISEKLNIINKELENLDRNSQDNDKLLNKQQQLLSEFEIADGHKTISSYLSYLKSFGITNQQLNFKVKNLSGGEQKKILLSLGLISRSNLILWDEPTNHLDLESIKLFEDELSQINSTYIIVTHDRYLLSKLTNKIFHIDEGKIKIFEGGYTQYLEFLQNKRDADFKLLEKLKNNMKREKMWMNQGIKARGTRNKKRVENYHLILNEISTIKNRTNKEFNLKIDGSSRKTKKLIQLKNLSFSYSAKINQLIANINLSIYRKDKIGLLGKNGVGKSTLTRLLEDETKLNGIISGDIYRAQNLIIRNFTQKREELKDNETPYDVLGGGSDFIDFPDGSKRHIFNYFESFLFNKDDIYRPLKTFSGGEKNRLQLALNLKYSGDLLIFDEPTNDLDLETLQLLEKKLQLFNGSLIVISHDRAFLEAVTNRIWLLDNNKIECFEGGYEQVGPYLDALEMEKSIKEIYKIDNVKNSENNAKVDNKKQTKKLSNKEKLRLKSINCEIEALEQNLDKSIQEIENFDFSQINEQVNSVYKEKCKKRDELEEKLLELYEELDSLNSNL